MEFHRQNVNNMQSIKYIIQLWKPMKHDILEIENILFM